MVEAPRRLPGRERDERGLGAEHGGELRDGVDDDLADLADPRCECVAQPREMVLVEQEQAVGERAHGITDPRQRALVRRAPATERQRAGGRRVADQGPDQLGAAGAVATRDHDQRRRAGGGTGERLLEGAHLLAAPEQPVRKPRPQQVRAPELEAGELAVGRQRRDTVLQIGGQPERRLVALVGELGQELHRPRVHQRRCTFIEQGVKGEVRDSHLACIGRGVDILTSPAPRRRPRAQRSRSAISPRAAGSRWWAAAAWMRSTRTASSLKVASAWAAATASRRPWSRTASSR